MIRSTMLCITLVMLAAVAVQAGEVTTHHVAALPQLELQTDGFHHFVHSSGPVFGQAAQPEMPHFDHQLLLPPGEEIQSASIANPVWTLLPGKFRLYPAQPPVPLSQTELPPLTPPDPTIYTSNTIHPANPVSMSRTDFLSGSPSALLSVPPTSSPWVLPAWCHARDMSSTRA